MSHHFSFPVYTRHCYGQHTTRTTFHPPFILGTHPPLINGTAHHILVNFHHLLFPHILATTSLSHTFYIHYRLVLPRRSKLLPKILASQTFPHAYHDDTLLHMPNPTRWDLALGDLKFHHALPTPTLSLAAYSALCRAHNLGNTPLRHYSV